MDDGSATVESGAISFGEWRPEWVEQLDTGRYGAGNSGVRDQVSASEVVLVRGTEIIGARRRDWKELDDDNAGLLDSDCFVGCELSVAVAPSDNSDWPNVETDVWGGGIGEWSTLSATEFNVLSDWGWGRGDSVEDTELLVVPVENDCIWDTAVSGESCPSPHSDCIFGLSL